MTASRRWNLGWFAAGTAVALLGLGDFIVWVGQAWGTDGWWGIDLRLVLDAGSRLASSEPLYADSRVFDAPLAVLVGRLLGWIDFDLLSVGLAILKFALAAMCVAALTPGWRLRSRILAFAAVAFSLPFLHDVMLGNVNVFLVAAMVPAIFGRPRGYNGVPLGLLAAAFPKPLLLPVLLWLLVWRPRVFGATVGSAVAGAALPAVLLGPGVYGAWLAALQGTQRFASPFAGNHGVSALLPELWGAVAAITALGLVVVVAKRGPTVGLAWAVTSGILIAPYAGTYAALPIAIAVPPLAAVAPFLAIAIVALAPIAVTHALPLYAAGILVVSLAVREPELAPTAWRARGFEWPYLAREPRRPEPDGEPDGEPDAPGPSRAD